MSEWKDSYESDEGHLKGIADNEKEKLRLLKLDMATDGALKAEQLKMQKLNLGICIYRDFGRDQDKWPAWIRAKATELGIE